jgi:hypothetical protein
LGWAETLFAQGSLLLYPRRVVFEGNKKIQEINVANNGKDTARYSVTLVDLQMKEDGNFSDLNGDSLNGLSNHLRFYPKHILLAPGQAQVIKLQLINRLGNKLAQGEYRSHLRLKPIKVSAPNKSKQRQMTTKVKLRIRPTFSFTVPVLVRVGEVKYRVSVSDLFVSSVGDTIPELNFTINRTGNTSVLGDIYIYFESEGRTVSIASVLGFAVYYPNERRSFKVNIKKKGIDYRNGRFHVLCTTQVEERQVKLAEAFLNI